MNADLVLLLIAQFLSAFADNATLFTAVALAMQNASSWYLAALQGGFLLSFVLLAPWVGSFADTRPKSRALTIANLVKASGVLLMLGGLDPLLSYMIVGVGAALYGPSKYGALPELVAREDLVRTNGWIEGATILAIISGSLVGGFMADRSLSLDLVMIAFLFIAAAGAASRITKHAPRSPHWEKLSEFPQLIRELLRTTRARFCVLSIALFWATIATMRVALVAWAAVVLSIHDSAEVAELTVASALGSVLGALLVPFAIPLDMLPRTRLAAYALGAALILLGASNNIWEARFCLLLIGLAGGFFLVPINASLQDIGYKTIGSGHTVAVQQFCESLAMATATSFYGLVVAQGVYPTLSMLALGALVLTATTTVSWRLSKLL